MIGPCLRSATIASLLLTVGCSTQGQVHVSNPTLSGVTVKTLAQGSVSNLPAGKVIVNVLEFHQLPGAEFGPHAHLPQMVYTLHGVSTISFAGAAARSVGPGEAAFIPALAVHTHQNVDGRIGAGAIALGLIFVVILLCAAMWMRGGPRRITIATLLLLLIAGGALPLIGTTSNDFYLITVRPESGPDQPMPRPDGRNIYTSPEIDPVPAAPCVETLRAITVPPGARDDAPDVAGPQLIIVVEGTAAVHIGDQTQQLGRGGMAFAQAGTPVAIVNSGSDTLQVVDFAVMSAGAAAT